MKVFVTGASSGLGEAIALEYARRHPGARIGLAARRRDALDALAARMPDGVGVPYAVDVTDRAAMHAAAADFVAKHEIKRVAFVIPEDVENGPPDFKIAPDADVTVVCYKGGEVKANHAFAKGGLSDEKVDAIVEASCKLVD